MTDYHIKNKDTHLYYDKRSKYGVENPNSASRFFSKEDAENHLSEREEVIEHRQAFDDYVLKTYNWGKPPSKNNTMNLEITRQQARIFSSNITEMLSNPYPVERKDQILYIALLEASANSLLELIKEISVTQ